MALVPWPEDPALEHEAGTLLSVAVFGSNTSENRGEVSPARAGCGCSGRSVCAACSDSSTGRMCFPNCGMACRKGSEYHFYGWLGDCQEVEGKRRIISVEIPRALAVS